MVFKKSKILLNITLFRILLNFYLSLHAFSGDVSNLQHFPLLQVGGIESELLWLNQPTILFKCPNCILNDIPKLALVCLHPAHIVVVVVGQSSCDGHDEHLEANECILNIIGFTSKLLMMVL